MKLVRFNDGLAIHADSTSQSTVDFVKEEVGSVTMIHTDPPYSGILNEAWDKQFLTAVGHMTWMLEWTKAWCELLPDGGAFYVWGGVGTYRNRPFPLYTSEVESFAPVKIQNLITWGKKRGIGTAYNYLFTREELAFMIKGQKNSKPRVFNVPLLDTLRGYEGYNKNYPAKSEYKRRTNVWTDVTEILRGKVHVAEKASRVCEIPIEVSSNSLDYVLDPFAGSGTTALAARKLGRRWIMIENDEKTFEEMVRRLGGQI